MPTRREFLAGGLAVLATACTGGGKGPVTIEDLTKGAPQLSLLGLGPGAIGGSPDEPVQTGTSIVTFDLTTTSQIREGGTPRLYVARSSSARAGGPFSGVWTPF